MIDIDRDRYSTVVVGSDMFVLDERTGETLRIGGAGLRLWELLVGGMSPEEAARTIADTTDAPYERVLADTLAFVERLRSAGVISTG